MAFGETLRRIVTLLVLTLAATTLVAPHAVSAEPRVPRLRTATLELAEELRAPADAVAPADAAPTDGDGRSAALEAPIEFSGIWAEVPAGVDAVRVRTADADGRWSNWAELDTVDDADGPDEGTAEAEAAAAAAIERAGREVTEYLAVGQATELQVELVGGDAQDLADTALEFVDTDGLNEGLVERTVRRLLPTPVPAEASEVLPDWIRPRSDWGAVEPRTSTSVASGGVDLVVVHHTAGHNGYAQEEVPGILRGIQRWHIEGNGWNDVGYNAMVDRFGQVWEGRAGGLEQAVVGAHARNYNTGSFGVAVLGNYVAVQASDEALEAVAKVIGWKADLHGFDTEGTTNGWGASRPVVVGHRDVGTTSCPGRIQERLPEIRSRARVLTTPFEDVVSGPHRAAISQLAARSVIQGCAPGRFCPTQQVTRAQAASLLQRALDLPLGDGSHFTDVTRGATHEAAIGAVAAHGYLGGYGDGRFGPEEPMSRAHMASALARAMRLAPLGGDAFSDVHPSSTHGGNIYALYDAGVTQGCATPGRFCPDATVTREQMASFVDRMLRR